MLTLQIGYPVRGLRGMEESLRHDPQAGPPRRPVCPRVPGCRGPEQRGRVLDFESKDAATGFLEKLRSQVWDKPDVIGQLMTASPTAKILEEVARKGQAAG